MAPEKPNLPDDLKDDNRDVADLWKDALKAYKGIVGFDLEKKFDNVEAMIKQGTHEMNNFHKFRHNEKKVDKLRTLFAMNVDYVEKGAQQLIAAAVPAFPPAAAIGTAITYMLGACRQVSADYDVVVVFFEDMNSFLQRIVILETRLPQYKAYQNCLMDVFTSFLKMCGYAHKYIELGRFKKWVTNLLHGEDSELGGARKTMDKKLARLQNATEFAILGNTEELQRMSKELKNNQDSHTAMLQEQMEVMGSIRDTTENIRNDMAKLLKAFNEQKKEKGGERGRNAVVDQSKPPSAKRIRNVLPEVEGEDHEYHILKDTIVKDTCNWVFNEAQWEEWIAKESRPLLAITGEPGTGKSHIGATVYEKFLEEARKDAKHICAAHFYFREQSQSLSGFIYALITIINQVVEQNAPICELINTEWLKDEVAINVWDWDDLMRKLLAPAFKKGSKNHLYLMLDGIDELQDMDTLIEFLEIIKEEELRISIVTTSRPDVLPKLSEVVSVVNMEVNKEKQLDDLKELVWNRLNSLSDLRNFGRYVKQRIADKVQEFAPNMLYAEHMLLQLNDLGREGAVLRSLDKPLPGDLHDLYEALLTECYRHLASNHEFLVNRLLHWVAYAFRPLSLNEVVSLLSTWAEGGESDIEEIPRPLTKFIRVGDPGADAEARAKIQSQGGWGTAVNQLERTQDATPDAIYDDGTLPVKFHERSMRSFFREAPRKEETQRWKPSEAHRQLFLDCAKMARKDSTVIPYLRQYATRYLISHWKNIKLEEHSTEEQAEVMEAFGLALLNKYSYATLLEQQDAAYKDIFPDDVFDKVSQWAKLNVTLGQEVTEWWADLAENPRNCLVPLAKAHLTGLYNAINTGEAVKRFNRVRDALQLSNMNDRLVEQAKKNFGDAVGDTSKPLSPAQASFALEDLFDDIEMGASGYRAVSTVLLTYKHYEPAEATCLKAIEKAEDPLEKVNSYAAMGRILIKGNPEKAYEYANLCMENLDPSMPTWVQRWSNVTKARIEVKLEKFEEAAQTYTQAKLVDPNGLTIGDVLDEEIAIFSKDEERKGFMDVLKKWSPLERLTWMAWQHETMGPDRHRVIRDAAIKAGETDFLIQMYEESIKYLDNVNAAAPLRCDLAIAHLEVHDDPAAARKVLDEVLDSGSTGWPYAVTDELPESTLERAIGHQSEMIYRLFRQSRDPEEKRELLESLEGLLTRPLPLDVPPNSDTFLFLRLVTMARMYLKMGPAREAHKNLQGVINTCIEALSDKVGWNDSPNLIFLATALSIMAGAVKNGDKLIRMARILVSAEFSRLTPDPEDESEDDESGDESESEGSDENAEPAEEDSDDEELEFPTNEGDLLGEFGIRTCDGPCIPNKHFYWWGDRSAYQCLICFDGFLCEECYEKRQAANNGEPLNCRHFCGQDHEYIKVPIEGWKGVKDGKMMIEGEEPVEFQELLRQIREELCKEAWDSFWYG
ncbi:hypothetical protein BHE90_005917 [Fusarium euwallaceae]|uniref:Uncharacterized protein n=1 Tax=Fusarium euwallaceae TaxID=1147111 RepID=A0A430LV50_9HYPO|nr:hypothetical protein BHE90_005917 [Fusarium euwallaceae]